MCCVTAGWVAFSSGDRPVVFLTQEGQQVMLGNRSVRLRLPLERTSRDGEDRRRSSTPPPAGAPLAEGDEALFQAIMAGAAGYVLKQIRSTDLVDAVRRVAAGQNLLDPAVTARVLERLRKGPDEDERLARLTDQEREVLLLLSEGLTNRQIGERLHLAEKTIKNYVTMVLSKLGMSRRTEAAVYAARHLKAREDGGR